MPEAVKSEMPYIEDRIIEALYALDDGEEVNLNLGWARSRSNYEVDTKKIHRYINELCSAFGINSENAEQSFISCTVNPDRFDERDIPVSVLRHALLHGRTLSSYLSELAFMSLPIESMEDDEAHVLLVMRGNEGETIEFSAFGNLEVLWGDEESESELNYHTKYWAQIMPAQTS